MERYDQLYSLYEEFDTETLRAYQEFADVLPPVDSRVVLEQWESADEELADRKGAIRKAFPEVGETFADIAAHATRNQAFTALDLLQKYGRGVNVLILDVDETLRSAGNTDNEIPRETLHALTEFQEAGLPVVICTGQTLENVKGFMIQGLGNELVHAGRLPIVYEAGTGVFAPGHGSDTKQLLYEELSSEIRAVFDRLRSRILSDAPAEVRRCCHLQGNEFNITLKPNFQTGSRRAREVIDQALVYQLDLLGEAVAAETGDSGPATETGTEPGDDFDPNSDSDPDPDREPAADPGEWARAYYAAEDPEIRGVLERRDRAPTTAIEAIPAPVADTFERIDVAYYDADAAEIGSLELNKVVGVERALDVLGVDDPFALVMGDSKSDLRVMEWVEQLDAGLAAAPEHASRDVLDHVLDTDELVFDRGKATEPLRTVYALNRLAAID